MRNFRIVKNKVLFWKSIIYRIISTIIFTLIFGHKIALLTASIALILYYIYDYVFHKFFKISTDKGFVLWFTGLSCSGKTTLADIIAKKLKPLGIKVERLDGDVIRKGKLSDDLKFSKEDRDKNIKRVTFVSKLLSRNGVAVLASFVSPYRKTRQQIRDTVTNFIEVAINANPKVCALRDVKGMWNKASKGEIKGFTGYDAPYEYPLQPEIYCNTDYETIEESVAKIIHYLRQNKYI